MKRSLSVLVVAGALASLWACSTTRNQAIPATTQVVPEQGLQTTSKRFPSMINPAANWPYKPHVEGPFRVDVRQIRDAVVSGPRAYAYSPPHRFYRHVGPFRIKATVWPAATGPTVHVGGSARGASHGRIRPSATGCLGCWQGALSDKDVTAAASQTQVVVVAGGYLVVSDLSGNQEKVIETRDLFCPTDPPAGTQIPSVCSYNGGPGDVRVVFDARQQHFIVSGLWTTGTGIGKSDPNADNVLAITIDPTEQALSEWNRYSYPSCGKTAPIDVADKPLIGVNNLWIVVNTRCDPRLGSFASLAIFDKMSLYQGNAPAVGTNLTYKPFSDAMEEYENPSNPVLTYTTVPTINNREYLTASAALIPGTNGGSATIEAYGESGGYAGVVYGHIEGTAGSPQFYEHTDLVPTPYQAISGPLPSLPMESSAQNLQSNALSWMNSSGVWTFHDGGTYMVSTATLARADVAGGTKIVTVATSAGGGGKAFQIEDGQQEVGGPLASEVTFPSTRSTTFDQAEVVYDYVGPKVFPQIRLNEWNVDSGNSVDDVLLMAGTEAPPASTTDPQAPINKWVDFLAAAVPIPGTSNFLWGASVAVPLPIPSATPGPRSNFYEVMAPVNTGDAERPSRGAVFPR